MSEQHKDVAAMAVKAFEKHVLTRERGFTWRMGVPRSSFYAFRVTWAHGALIITGDLGEIVYTGPRDFWHGPWDAARFVLRADYDYLTGKSNASTEFDQGATVLALLRAADYEQREAGTKALWREICGRYGGLDHNLATDQMRAAKWLREDCSLTAEQAYNLAGDFEMPRYSWPARTRWQYEALQLWAAAMVPAEPLSSRLARQRRRFRNWRADFKRAPILHRPEIFTGPPGYGALKFWRLDPRGSYRLLMPFRLFGQDLSRFGLWRDQGSSTPAARATGFTKVSA